MEVEQRLEKASAMAASPSGLTYSQESPMAGEVGFCPCLLAVLIHDLGTAHALPALGPASRPP